MNLLKRQNPAFSYLFDDFILNQDWGYQKDSLPAVNIITSEDQFDIELATPGNKKADFQIEVEDDVLIISSETVSQSGDTETSYERKEFGYNSFQRSFNIPESVNTDKISATYKEGVLTVSLPKKEEALPQPKKFISIK
ncbi:MAG: Hsp20/alpha crystallin family protein [Flavobacteriaceae bacterium TMED121]|nr:MAG: Hsp20/alpha crystallin family protein [Flavobacteriaceae bacterium TMED121]